MYSKKFIAFSIFVAVVAITSAFIFHQRTTSKNIYEATKQFNNYTLLAVSSIISSESAAKTRTGQYEIVPFYLHHKSAIVFGGTSGIGSAIAIRLSAAGVKNVTIVGRNKKEGERIVKEMNRVATAPQPNHQFVPADLMFLKTCNELINKNEQLRNNHNKSLHFVVYCQTKATLQGHTPTPNENIDEKLALNFYSRMYLTKLLVPWMKKSRDLTKKRFKDIQHLIQPRFLSVLSAGVHAPYPHWKTDTRLSKALYSQKLAADITSFYTDLVFDRFAVEANSDSITTNAKQASSSGSEIGFVHASPGFVESSWGSDMPQPLLFFIRLMQAAAGRPAKECAEFMLRALIEPVLGTRDGYDEKTLTKNNVNGKWKREVILVDEYGRNDKIDKTALHLDVSVDHVWKDTMSLFDEVEKGF